MGLAGTNWEPDDVLAKRVFGRLLRRDRKTAIALNISKEVFKKYMETLEASGLVGPQLEQELAFRERIREIIQVITANEQLLDEAARVCFEIGPLKEKVEERAKREYQDVLKELLARLECESAIKQKEYDLISKQLVDLQETLAASKQELKENEEELTKRIDGFEEELSNRLRVLTDKPERVFAEMAITKAFSSRAEPGRHRVRKILPSHVAHEETCTATVEQPADFVGALSHQLLGMGISPSVAHSLHSVLLSGSIPIIIGAEAHDLLSAYSDRIAGGVLHWIPVGGSVYEPCDMLARFDTHSATLVPHPGGLLDILLDNSDNLHIVVLDGFNRAATEGYLIPLIQSATDVARGRKPRTIPLFAPGTIAEDSPYQGCSRISWNPNVLLVLCPSNGTSALPIPRELWRYCSVIDSEIPTEVKLETNGIMATTRVKSIVWNHWVGKARQTAAPSDKMTKSPEGGSNLPRSMQDKLNRLFGACSTLGLSEERAFSQAVRLGILPYLAVWNEPLEDWCKTLELQLDKADERIIDTVRKLGE